MRCSICREEVSGDHKFFMVLRTTYGYILVRGCEHTRDEIVEKVPLEMGHRLVGIVNSANCLGKLIGGLESRVSEAVQ